MVIGSAILRFHPLKSLVTLLLLTMLAAGSLMLWTAVPAASLWAASKLTESKAQHFLVGLPLTAAAMIAWGVLLFSVNSLFLRVTAFPAPPEETDETSPRRGPLEPFLVWSLFIAFVSFLVWFFAFAKNPPPGIEL